MKPSRTDLVLFGDLDEEGGAELTTPREERIVDVELVLHAGIIGDPLDPAHLLDLEEQGVAVLEDEGEVPADGHPPAALELDDPRARLLAHLLVLEEVQDVLPLDLLVPHEAYASGSP